MDSQTLELFRCLQSGPYDETGLERIRRLLQTQRRLLRMKNDTATLAEIIELMQGWAEATPEPRLATLAMLEASDIAERELRQPERAAQLRAEASADADERDAAQKAEHFAALGARRGEAGDLDGAIEAYERALDAAADVEIIYALADLYTQRARSGDAEQAADLYCTLGDVLGNPEGILMLERALALAPKHVEARKLFDSYVAAQYPSAGKVPPPLAASARSPAAAGPPPYTPRRQPNQPPPAASGWSSLPPIVVEDAAQRPKRGARRLLIGTALAASAAAVAVVLAIYTGKLDTNQLGVNQVLVAVGIAHAPAPPVVALPTPPVAAGVSLPAPEPSMANTATAGSTAATGTVPTPAPTASAATDTNIAPEASAVPNQQAESATPKAAAQTAVAPEVHALFDQVSVRGGKLNDQQLSAAIDKATPKLERCYAEALKDKPKTKGKLTFGWTVRTNGKATSVKELSGSIKDHELSRCTAQVIEGTHFPKPHKQAAQIKLPLEYRRAS